jgi:hypothetical protein
VRRDRFRVKGMPDEETKKRKKKGESRKQKRGEERRY